MGDELDKPNKIRLPWFYKVLLGIPLFRLGLSSASGIFWAIIVPIFMILNFLNILLISYFQFPLNVILLSIVPVITFLFFVRVSLERFINWWNSAFSTCEWNLDKAVQEYVNLVNKKQMKSRD